MAVILSCLLIAHMLGDFILQSSKMAEKKKAKLSVLLIHSSVYLACMLVFLLLCIKASEIWLPFLILAISHFIIDYIRAMVLERKYIEAKKELILFIIDQVFHIAIIVIVVLIFDLGSRIGGVLNYFIGAGEYVQIKSIVLIAAVYIASLNPAAVLVKEVLTGVFGENDKTPTEEKKTFDGSGYLIGIFERIITVTFVLINQFGALGFVLAAKSVARFKQIEEDKGFAERYLVGTLLSVTFALCGTMLVKLFI